MRNSGWDHHLWDSVRGVGSLKGLSSNNTNSEAGNDTANATWGYIDSIDSDGFTTYANGSFPYSVHQNNFSYVAWFWKAGGTAVSNTNGSITSTVSANVDAGFSIVKYTGTNTSGATIGHGLSSAPEMVAIFARDTAEGGTLTFKPLYDSNPDYYMYYHNTQEAIVQPNGLFWAGTAPSNTLITLGSHSGTNHAGGMIAYCFHSVDGYSKVGSYVGNDNDYGPFIYTGFRPAYVMIKLAYPGDGDWTIIDNRRDPYNDNEHTLHAQSSSNETIEANQHDFTANGFKLRTRDLTSRFNGNGRTYVYIAFADQPFKHSNAR
jgi:hypothetical protein